MADTVSELNIKVNAEASKANDAIDKLVTKLDKLTIALGKVDGTGNNLNTLSVGVQKLSSAMQTMNNVKTADFTRLAKNLQTLNNVDVSNLSNISKGIQNISGSFGNMSNVPKGVNDLTKLSNSLSKLSGTNVKSLETVDFSTIGNQISGLANSLANAPKIQQSIITMTNAISNLAKSGTNIGATASQLELLGSSLNKFMVSIASAPTISESTIGIVNAIGVLAKSGNTMSNATSNLSALGKGLKDVMTELSTAPKVSKNVIAMTDALAKLARTGSSSGRAADSLANSFNKISKSSINLKSGLVSVVGGITSVRRSILQAMGIAGGFYAVIQGIKSAIDISSDLTEVQNVVDVAFGDYKQKIEDLAKVSIPELGMSELTAKTIAGRFQAMGTAIGFSQGKMSDMSVELTRLAGDMASFYNVEQKDVAKSLQSVFTGETEPMRKYGIDLTNATLKEWAMKQGIDANISSMSQMEKTALRYQYVMQNTGAAQGDFIRTADTWANQVRVLKENFSALAAVIGSSFIHALKPLVKALNSAMSAIISFAKVVSNALGKIFGWKYEDTTGGIANDFEDAAGSADDLASGTGAAANNAKKLKQQLQGIDELNVLTTNEPSGSGGSGGGGGAGGGSQDASGGQWTQTDSILKDFESSLDSLYKLGEYIGDTLTDTLNSINWNKVYQGARSFGSGLASFLNGLISPELFYATGRTIANSLNTAIYAVLSFGETFNFADFGNSIASGINGFFQNFDFRALAETLNTWVHGIEKTIMQIAKNVDWKSVIEGIFDFITTLDADTVAVGIGALVASKLIPAIKESATTGLSAWATDTLVPTITAKASSIAAGLSAWATGTAIPAITTFCTTTLPTIISGLSSILNVAVPLVLAFGFGWQAGKDLFEAGSGQSPDTWGGWRDFFKLDATAEEIRNAIADGAVTEFTLTPLIKWIADDDSIDTSEVTDALAEMFSDFMDTTGLGDVFVALTDVDFWKSVPGTWKEIGSNCIKGLKQGLGDIWSKIKGAFKKALEGVKKFFGIHSPSTVFEEIGRYMIEGLVSGIGNVWEKIKGAFSGIGEKVMSFLGLDEDKEIKISTKFNEVKNIGSKLSSWVLDKIRKTGNKSLKKDISTAFTDSNPNSLVSWVMKKIKGNPNESVTKDISTTFRNASSDNLVSWVMKKIKENQSASLKKNISSKLEKAASSNSLIAWLLEKIKGSTNNFTKNVTTGMKKGDSNSLIEWLLDKIRGSKPLSKSVSVGTSISGYSALQTFKNTWDSLKSKTIEFELKFSALASDLKTWINGHILVPINVAFSKVPILRNHQIPYLANGGMLDGKGQMFIAREKGPELVASYGNKSAVMNNNQIVESVSSGVAIAVRNANTEQNALLRQQNEILYQLLEKDTGISYKDVFNATRKANNEYKSVNGVSAFA